MKKLISLVLSLVLLAANAAALADGNGSVSLNGSTSMEKVVGVLAEQFMLDNPGITVTYDATGSGTGISAARQGTCDIGLASRDLKEAETELTAYTVALDGIAVIVNAGSGVEQLTVEQIAGIFTGKIVNWSEVGGADLAIACIGREAGSGTRDGFETVTKTADACVLAQELTSTGAVIQAVASSENAIGYASLSSVEGNSGVKAVKVNGVICSEETVISGEYAIQRPFNMVVAQNGELSEAAGAFLTFALSPEAAQLIRLAGAVPVAADDNASGK